MAESGGKADKGKKEQKKKPKFNHQGETQSQTGKETPNPDCLTRSFNLKDAPSGASFYFNHSPV